MHGNTNVKQDKSVRLDVLRDLLNSNLDHFLHKSLPPEYRPRQVILVYNFTVYSTNTHSVLSFHLRPSLPSCFFPHVFKKIAYTTQPLRIPTVHPLRHHIAILNLITLKLVCTAGNTVFQLFNFPHRPVVPSVTEVQEFTAILPSRNTNIHSHFKHLML